MIKLQNSNPQISKKYCTTLSRNIPKRRLFKPIYLFCTLNRRESTVCICELAQCGSIKSKNHKNDWIRNSQIRTVPDLLKVRKSKKPFKSVYLRIWDVLNLFADRPLLLKRQMSAFCSLILVGRKTGRIPSFTSCVISPSLLGSTLTTPSPGYTMK